MIVMNSIFCLAIAEQSRKHSTHKKQIATQNDHEENCFFEHHEQSQGDFRYMADDEEIRKKAKPAHNKDKNHVIIVSSLCVYI